jgi:hypothetical protein
MPDNCPYCGSTVNFGLRFCVVCGREVGASNKIGSVSIRGGGAREADLTRRLDEDALEAQKYSKRKSLRFKKHVRGLSQTIMYGFIAGALFFCAIRLVSDAAFPGTVKRVLNPLVHPFIGSSKGAMHAAPEEGKTDTAHAHTKGSKKTSHKHARSTNTPHTHNRRVGACIVPQ